MKRTRTLLLVSILFFTLFLVPQRVQAEIVPPSSNFSLKRTVDDYNLLAVENGDWLAVKIEHQVLGFNNSIVSSAVEYVAIDKNRRGEIGFTHDGEYVARLIPILVGKSGGSWYLIPLTGASIVTDSGWRAGNDEDGHFVEIFYSGGGSFTAYKYNEWSTQFGAQVTINDLSIRVHNSTGKAKINANVTSSQYALDDSGFGFLFVPENLADFRYAKFTKSEGEEVSVDLTTVGVVSDVGLILDFWSQTQDTLGVKWDWEDLYSLGGATHFEVIDIGGIKGILTGSYLYGAKSTSDSIIVDPTLSLTTPGSAYVVENTWTESGSTVGYNFTINPDTGLGLEEIYNFWENGYYAEGTDNGIYTGIYANDTMKYAWDMTGSVTILEETDTRIRLNMTASTDINGALMFSLITCTVGSPVVGFSDTWWNNTAWVGDPSLEKFYFIFTRFNTRFNETDVVDLADDYWAINQSAYGSIGFVSSNFDIKSLTDHDSATINRSWAQRNFTAADPVSTGWSWDCEDYFLIFGKAHTDASTWIAEWDDEIADAFNSISSLTGVTDSGRNNETGAYDLAYTSGRIINFTMDMVGTDSNFTALHITNYPSAIRIVDRNGTLLTEDTDYYAAYNASSDVLDLIFESPESDSFYTIEADAVMIHITIPDDRYDLSSTIRVNANVTYALDGVALNGSSSVSLNGSAMTYSGSGDWWYLDTTQSSVGLYNYTGSTLTEGVYSLTQVGAIEFDGVDDQVTTSTITYNLTTGGVTFAFWASKDDIALIGWIMTRAQSSMRYIMLHTNGNFYIETDLNGDVAYAPYVEDTVLHLFTVSVTSGTVAMYQDETTLVMTDDTVTDNITLNAIGNAGSSWNKGFINEVRIYNVGLTASEVSQLYRGYDPHPSNLIMHLNPSSWNQTSGIWEDLSGEDNDGTITGARVNTGALTDRVVRPVHDRIQLTSLTSSDVNVPINTNIELRAQAQLEHDSHALTSGDSFTIDGINFAWDASDSRFEATVVSATPVTNTYDTYDSGSEATYGITEGDENSQTVSVTWYSSGGGGGGGGGGSEIPLPPGSDDGITFPPPSPWIQENGAIVITLVLLGVVMYEQFNKPSPRQRKEDAMGNLLGGGFKIGGGGFEIGPDVGEDLGEFARKIKRSVWEDE